MKLKYIGRMISRPIKTIYSLPFIYELLDKKRMHLWLVAVPKSGSTWLSAILTEYLNWKTCALVNSYDRREQEVEPYCLMKRGARRKHVFSPQQHCRYCSNTQRFIDNTDVKI